MDVSNIFLYGPTLEDIRIMAKWTGIALVHIPLFIFIGWVFFRDADDFFDSLYYTFTPDIITGLQGECGDDRWGTLKFTLWLLACISCMIGEYFWFTGELPAILS